MSTRYNATIHRVMMPALLIVALVTVYPIGSEATTTWTKTWEFPWPAAPQYPRHSFVLPQYEGDELFDFDSRVYRGWQERRLVLHGINFSDHALPVGWSERMVYSCATSVTASISIYDFVVVSVGVTDGYILSRELFFETEILPRREYIFWEEIEYEEVEGYICRWEYDPTFGDPFNPDPAYMYTYCGFEYFRVLEPTAIVGLLYDDRELEPWEDSNNHQIQLSI